MQLNFSAFSDVPPPLPNVRRHLPVTATTIALWYREKSLNWRGIKIGGDHGVFNEAMLITTQKQQFELVGTVIYGPDNANRLPPAKQICHDGAGA